MIKAQKIIQLINKQNSEYERKNNVDSLFSPKINFVQDKKQPIILKVSDLCKTFKTKQGPKVVLNNINLTIRENEKIALIGVNGAGKTTFLEIISGVQKPTSGKVNYGFNYINTPYEKIGIQFQISHYPRGLTVKDIIGFLVNINKETVITKKEIDQGIEMFGLKDLLKKEANSLSGGQKQRLNILLALLNKPKLLLLDELTTGLDVNSQKIVISYLQKFLKVSKISFMCVSHNIMEIENLCTRLVMLKKGKIVCDADISKLKNKYGSIEKFLVENIR